MTVLKHGEPYNSASILAEFALVRGGSSVSQGQLRVGGIPVLSPGPTPSSTGICQCCPRGRAVQLERKEDCGRRLWTGLFLLKEVTGNQGNWQEPGMVVTFGLRRTSAEVRSLGGRHPELPGMQLGQVARGNQGKPPLGSLPSPARASPGPCQGDWGPGGGLPGKPRVWGLSL